MSFQNDSEARILNFKYSDEEIIIYALFQKSFRSEVYTIYSISIFTFKNSAFFEFSLVLSFLVLLGLKGLRLVNQGLSRVRA